MCIFNHMQSTSFFLRKFLKKLTDDRCSSITKESIYYTSIIIHTTFQYHSITKGSIYHIKCMYINHLPQQWIEQKFDVKWKYLLCFILHILSFYFVARYWTSRIVCNKSPHSIFHRKRYFVTKNSLVLIISKISSA